MFPATNQLNIPATTLMRQRFALDQEFVKEMFIKGQRGQVIRSKLKVCVEESIDAWASVSCDTRTIRPAPETGRLFEGIKKT